MIRNISINVLEFIRSWLPPHKRQPSRLALLKGLAAPMATLMADWLHWRLTAVTRARVTGETMSLEWYLNRLYDPTLKRIYIKSAGADGLPLATTGEATPNWEAGIEASELAASIAVPLPGETSGLGTASFGVYIPTELNGQRANISRIVRSYKIAGKSFVIKLF